MSLYLDFIYSYEFMGRRQRSTKTYPSTTGWDKVLAEASLAGYVTPRAVRREWPAYAWPGGYPIYYITQDGGVLCPRAANQELQRTLDPHDRDFFIVAQDIHWEGEPLICDHLGEEIQSAYGEVT